MKILIIGGTIFLGRHLIEAALAKGHEVTIFNRGRHNADLFPEVEKLRGDRENDVSALQGRSWDAAIDTCGYVPGVVKKSVEVLRDNIENYIFISSCSVYGNFNPDGSDENSSVAELTSEQVKIAEQIDTGDRVNASIYRESYGGLKALCEQTAEKLMPNRVLNVRAGLIVGEYDSVERFTYWVKRISDGGKVLALEEIRSVSGSDAKFVWANEEFLEEQKVEAWSEMPLWLPEKYNGIFEVKNDKAIADGLTFRPLSETIKETLNWIAVRPADEPLRAGMNREKEQKLLKILLVQNSEMKIHSANSANLA
ncbi:MAG: hypothetical protein LC778_13305 [Acidobacteria bacterium]|nr:hypothetical protein [Acidobacteriota bacterium]